jgi:lipopolysaccharide transport system ATP-binding protein
MLSRGLLVRDGEPQYVVGEYLKSMSAPTPHDQVLARSSDGRAALVAVDFLDEEGQVIDRVVSGQTFAIRCTFDTKDVTGSVAIDIGIDDTAGRRIANVSNLLTDEELRIDSPTTSFVCRIPQVPLAPGDYNLPVTLRGPHELELLCPTGVTLRVESGDFFGSGKMVESWWIGTSLMRHSWTAERASNRDS